MIQVIGRFVLLILYESINSEYSLEAYVLIEKINRYLFTVTKYPH